jgi:lysozyme
MSSRNLLRPPPVLDEYRIRSIKRHEGYSAFPYRDVNGKLTIGWGRNLTDRGISSEEAELMFENDIKRCRSRLLCWQWFRNLDAFRQGIVIEMAYNLGVSGVHTFERMIEALQAGDYERAAQEMLDSRWAQQVGHRAVVLAEEMITGKPHYKS